MGDELSEVYQVGIYAANLPNGEIAVFGMLGGVFSNELPSKRVLVGVVGKDSQTITLTLKDHEGKQITCMLPK